MKRTLWLLIGCVLFFSSCRWDVGAWWSDDAEKEESRIFRYDRLMDEFVSLNSFSALQRMNTEFPTPTRLLIEDVLGIGLVEDAHIEQHLRDYFLDSTMQVLLQDVHLEYSDLTAEEKELSSVFSQVKKTDPDFKIPFIYAQISGLNQSIVVGDSILGISLDKYLGLDYPLYKKYYHGYQRQMMDRSRLVPDAAFYYLSHTYPLEEGKGHTLLDFIVDYGKMHWVIAQCRHVSLEEEAGFTKERADWCHKHEARLWRWLQDRHALAGNDSAVVAAFMLPCTEQAVKEKKSANQIGLWFGLQIVDCYMKSHPELSVGELLRRQDYGTILRESGYNPVK